MRKLLAFLAVVALACSAQAQILILKAGADGVVFEPNPVVFPALKLSGTLVPNANDGAALGTTALGFSDLFLASGGTMHFANTDWVATHTTGILTVGTGDLRVTTVGTNTASVVTVGGTQTLAAKTLTAPVLGAATGTSVTLTGAIRTSSATLPIGYNAGAGFAVTQLTNKQTTVVSDTPSGAITMSNESLVNDTETTFQVTCASCAATDVPVVAHASAGTAGKYLVGVSAVAAGSFKITVSNVGATAGEAIVLNYAIIKGSAN